MLRRLPAALWIALLLTALLTGGLSLAALQALREAPVGRALDDSGLLEHIRTTWLPNTLYERSSAQLAERLPHSEASAAARGLVALTEDVVTPAWVDASRRALMDEAFAYMRRKREALELHISLTPLVERASTSLSTRLPRSVVFRGFYRWATGELTGRFIERSPALPFGIRLSHSRAHTFILDLLPARWVARVIVDELPDVTGYLTGRVDAFELVLPIGERRDVATELIAGLLRATDLRAFTFQNIIQPAVQRHLPEPVELPYGLTVTRAEVLHAIHELLDAAWFTEREHVLFRAALDYLTGRTDSLRLTLPLASRKAALVSLTSALVERKIDALLTRLPPCSPLALFSVVGDPLSAPTCRPPGRTLAATRRALGLAVSAHVEATITSQLPDTLVYTDADMRERIGERSWSVVQRIREGFRDGLRVDHSVLEPALAPVIAYTRPGVSLGPRLKPHLTPVRGVVFTLRATAWLAFGLIALLLLISLTLPRSRPFSERLQAVLARTSIACAVLVLLTLIADLALQAQLPALMAGLGLPSGLLQHSARAAALYLEGFTSTLYLLWTAPLLITLALGAYAWLMSDDTSTEG